MLIRRIVLNAKLALNGVISNKIRALLTGLGILFGVGAVICMLAIGTGARQNILEQLSLIGTNNIIINSIDPSEVEEEEEENQNDNQEETKKYSPGLSINDIRAIENILPTTAALSPEVETNVRVIFQSTMLNTRVVGIYNDYFAVNNLKLENGSLFTPNQMISGAPVAIVGNQVASRFFQNQNPIGKFIKCGSNWIQIVGVLESRRFNEELGDNFGVRDVNTDIYIPLDTYLLRFENRGAITAADIDRRGRRESSRNYHQIDRITVQIDQSGDLVASAAVITKILDRLHNENKDYYIEIPELLLEQQRQTQDTFNLVLAVIAAISLLVGGIGIMNIMLASVMERTREIGIRRSVGATGSDIRAQFLLEAVFISLLGGILGIIFGITAAHIITLYTGIPAIVTTWSILLSFGVASLTGLGFGYFPASRAANRDPIKSLRTE